MTPQRRPHVKLMGNPAVGISDVQIDFLSITQAQKINVPTNQEGYISNAQDHYLKHLKKMHLTESWTFYIMYSWIADQLSAHTKIASKP